MLVKNWWCAGVKVFIICFFCANVYSSIYMCLIHAESGNNGGGVTGGPQRTLAPGAPVLGWCGPAVHKVVFELCCCDVTQPEGPAAVSMTWSIWWNSGGPALDTFSCRTSLTTVCVVYLRHMYHKDVSMYFRDVYWSWCEVNWCLK